MNETIILWLFIMITMTSLVFCPKLLFNCFTLPQLLALSMLSAVGLVLGVSNGVIPINTPSIILFCFFIYLTTSIFWSTPFHNAKKEYSLQTVMIIVYFISVIFLNKNIIKWLSLSISLVLLFNLVYAYLQTRGIDFFFSNEIKKGANPLSPIGTIGNSNFLTSFICGSMWFSVYLSYVFNSFFLLIFLFAIYLVFFKTKVRAGQLSIVCSILFLFVVLSYFKFLLVGNDIFFTSSLSLVGLVILCFIIILKIKWNIFFYKPIDPKGKQVWYATFRYRICYWLGALELIKEKPLFGWGLWGYRKEVYRAQAQINDKDPRFLKPDRYITPQPRECHNDFLEHLVEFGIIGFLIFMVFISSVYYNGFVFLNNSINNKHDFLLMLVLLTNFTSLLVNGVFFFMLRATASALMFWITCGMITYLSVGGETNTFNPSIWTILFIIIVMSLFIWETIIKRTMSSFYFRKYCTTANMQNKNDNLVKAIKWSPHDSIYRTHAIVLLQEHYPFLANLHASVLLNYFDGQVPQGMAFYNVALARAKTKNIFDEAEFFLKHSNWVNPNFEPTLELLNSKDGIGVRSTFKGGRATMRIPEEAIVWKVNTFIKDVEISKLKLDLVKKEIETLELAIKASELSLQNILIQEKKRLNIPDSWVYIPNETRFVDPSTINES